MKIAICVPHYGDVKAAFFKSAANMIATTVAARIVYKGAVTVPLIRTFTMGSASIDSNRNVLVQRALSWGVDAILFCDSDMTFPRDALLRLLAADKPVIGCNYAARDASIAIAAQDAADGWSRVVGGKGSELVSYLGLGFCLLKAKIFDGLEGPWFRTTIGANGQVEEGEDGHFFALLRRRGVPVFVDHDLSEMIGHIGEREIRLKDLEGRGDADTVLSRTGTE